MKIVDLSHTIHADFPIFPGDPGIRIATHCTYTDGGYHNSIIEMGTHTATHVDALSHRLADGVTVDKVPLSQYVQNAYVLDLSDLDPTAEITVADLQPHQEAIATTKAVLLRTDWGEHVTEGAAYFSGYAGLSRAAATYLVDLGVTLVGVETPSVNSADHAAVHDLFFQGGVVLAENVTNLSAISGQTVLFCAAPLKLQGLEGAPVRAFALTDLQ